MPKPSKNPKSATKLFLESCARRAKRILLGMGEEPAEPVNRGFNRAKIRLSEKYAHTILDSTKEGPCASLARNMIDLTVSLDNYWAQLFPIIDEIDHKIKTQNCYLGIDPTGWYFRDSAGNLLSSGESLRLWLASHAQLYTDWEVEPFDREAE